MKDGKVFVSYAQRDEASRRLAGAVNVALRRHDAEAWALEGVPAGSAWAEELDQTLSEANGYVFLISPQWLESRWANFDLGAAVGAASKSHKPIVAATVGDIDMSDLPALLRSHPIINEPSMAPSDLAEAITRAVLRKI